MLLNSSLVGMAHTQSPSHTLNPHLILWTTTMPIHTTPLNSNPIMKTMQLCFPIANCQSLALSWLLKGWKNTSLNTFLTQGNAVVGTNILSDGSVSDLKTTSGCPAKILKTAKHSKDGLKTMGTGQLHCSFSQGFHDFPGFLMHCGMLR